MGWPRVQRETRAYSRWRVAARLSMNFSIQIVLQMNAGEKILELWNLVQFSDSCSEIKSHDSVHCLCVPASANASVHMHGIVYGRNLGLQRPCVSRELRSRQPPCSDLKQHWNVPRLLR